MSEEAAQRWELARLVRQLTESGRPQLEEQSLRRLKQLCRSSDRLVDAAYELTIKQLQRPHAERRLSALQLLDQLFRRSHRLRQRAIADLQLIIDLCFETAGPLPPPAPAARRLTAAAAAALRHWHDTYKDGYKKLAVGYRFLQQVGGDDAERSPRLTATAPPALTGNRCMGLGLMLKGCTLPIVYLKFFGLELAPETQNLYFIFTVFSGQAG